MTKELSTGKLWDLIEKNDQIEAAELKKKEKVKEKIKEKIKEKKTERGMGLGRTGALLKKVDD